MHGRQQQAQFIQLLSVTTTLEMEQHGRDDSIPSGGAGVNTIMLAKGCFNHRTGNAVCASRNLTRIRPCFLLHVCV